MSASLSGLTIGSLTLSPPFDPEVTDYTATTTNATNTVTATAKEAEAVLTLTCGETALENGKPVTWSEGENLLTVRVDCGGAQRVYTVTVTKS